MGGKLNISSSWELTVISLKVLKRFEKEAFDIVADLLENPNLQESYLVTARELVAESIRRAYDEPANIAFEKGREILFNGNGYGAVATVEGVRSYTLDQVKSAWQKHYQAGNTIIGISSSIEFSRVADLSRKNFSRIKEGERITYEVDMEDIKKRVRSRSNTIYLYPKEVPQATILLGTIAPDLGYQGIYPLKIMNYILGGGSFNSRLMKEIRVKRGLAYAVQSIMRFRRNTGVFLSFVQTGNKTAPLALSLMRENITRMSREKVTGNELAWSQKAIENSYIFTFDTPRDVLANYINIDYNQLPGDFYEKYIERIRNVNALSILKESKKLLDDGLITVVVGSRSLADRLKNQGTLIIIDGKENKGL
jgi:zinc protease